METLDLREQAVHGSSLFPLSFYRLDLDKNYPMVPLHYHEEMEVTYIVSGVALYQSGLDTFAVKEGDLLFMNPNVLHRITQIERQEMVSYTFVFHLDLLKNATVDICTIHFLNPLLHNIDQLPQKIEEGDSLYGELVGIFSKLNRCYEEKREGYQLLVKG